MSYTQKSIIVKGIVIIVIVLSSLLNGHLQMNRKVNQVEDIFMNGEDGSGLSIHYDLKKIDDSMSYCISLAKANHQENNRYIKQVNNLHKNFSSLKTIKQYSQWYNDVQDHFPLTMGYLESLSLSQEHRNMLSKYQATYKSATHTIAYSPYNQYVRDYQEETSGWFAEIIKKGTHVKEVDSFD